MKDIIRLVRINETINCNSCRQKIPMGKLMNVEHNDGAMTCLCLKCLTKIAKINDIWRSA